LREKTLSRKALVCMYHHWSQGAKPFTEENSSIKCHHPYSQIQHLIQCIEILSWKINSVIYLPGTERERELEEIDSGIYLPGT
jgi:hypothetical protein